MLINNSQLNKNINKNNKLYLLFGSEILLIQQSSDAILKYLKADGFTNKFVFDVDTRFNFSVLKDELVARDLFSNKKIIQINVLVNNAKITKELGVIASNIKEDIVVLILMKQLTPAQQKAKWFAQINNFGVIVQHFTVYAPQMKAWVITQMSKINLTANDKVAQIIAENNTGNLLSANNELQKLKFVYGDNPIELKEFTRQSKQQSIYSIYSLIDNALLANKTTVYKIYHQITIDTSHLTSLLYIQLKQLIAIHLKIKQRVSLNSALETNGVWRSKTNIITTALKQHTYPQLQKILLTLGRIERTNKGRDNINVKQNLLAILLQLAGAHNGIN